jgi:hypothetical protein
MGMNFAKLAEVAIPLISSLGKKSGGTSPPTGGESTAPGLSTAGATGGGKPNILEQIAPVLSALGSQGSADAAVDDGIGAGSAIASADLPAEDAALTDEPAAAEETPKKKSGGGLLGGFLGGVLPKVKIKIG